MIPWWFTALVDFIVSPFGREVHVVATVGRWGADRIIIVRAGAERTVRLGPWNGRPCEPGRMLAVLIVALAVLALAGMPAAFAQDAVIIATPSPWADFWAGVQAPLLAFVTAVLGALGVAIAGVIRRKFGAEAELAFNEVYRIAMEQAAGWLASRIAAGEPMSSDLVDEAVDYATRSYPEVRQIEPRLSNIAEDVIAAFGRLKAKG